jgi:hypothetical protein
MHHSFTLAYAPSLINAKLWKPQHNLHFYLITTSIFGSRLFNVNLLFLSYHVEHKYACPSKMTPPPSKLFKLLKISSSSTWLSQKCPHSLTLLTLCLFQIVTYWSTTQICKIWEIYCSEWLFQMDHPCPRCMHLPCMALEQPLK